MQIPELEYVDHLQSMLVSKHAMQNVTPERLHAIDYAIESIKIRKGLENILDGLNVYEDFDGDKVVRVEHIKEKINLITNKGGS